MLNSLVAILPEITASLVTLISPAIPKELILAFVTFALLKVMYMMRNDIENDVRSLAFIAAISCNYDASLLNRFLTGYDNEISGIVKDLICIAIGAVGGHLIIKLLNSSIMERASPKTVRLAALLVVFLSCGAIMAAFIVSKLMRKTLSPRGDGSIDVWFVSVQLPEVLKIELVIAAYLTKQLMKHKREYLTVFYISAGVIILTIAVAFKEFGSILQLLYFTFAVSLYLTTSRDVRPTVQPKESGIIAFVCSHNLPMLAAAAFFGTIGFVKRVLYTEFKVRGAEGEEIYGLDNRWFQLSSRLSADSPQIEYARGLFSEAKMLQLNFNSTVEIPYADLSTALADYSFVVTAAFWGKLVAIVIIILFTAVLGTVVFRRNVDMLARAAALMLLVQIFVHVSGILFHFCFTGVNLPFLSIGGSSLVSSVILSTFILKSLRRDQS